MSAVVDHKDVAVIYSDRSSTLGVDAAGFGAVSSSPVTSIGSKNEWPMNLSFTNIKYSISIKNTSTKKMEEKSILKNISGYAKAGTMIAIMGPTGSGKTSLLNVLARRCPMMKKAKLTGELRVNGEVVNEKAFARMSSYVMQDDAMFAALTVKETLMVAAHFQLSSKLSLAEKEDIVLAIISQLGLTKCQHTIIGDAKTRGVSGGERKRCNIGVELIKSPSALFLDEPTSGLDSFQAQSVMGAMKNLAENGRTVVASIHQPRSSIYAMFDQLLLIAEGRCIFSGPASAATEHFAAYKQICPPRYNPADFFLDVVSPDYRSTELENESLGRIKAFGDAWESLSSSSLTSLHDRDVEDGKGNDNTESVVKFSSMVLGKNFGYQSSWSRQFALCFIRSFTTIRRDKVATYGKIIGSVFFGLVLGALYSETSLNQKSIQDRIGILFFFTINQTFSNMFAVLNSFTSEKIVIERERASKSYHVSAFYAAKFCAEVPFNFVGPIVFGTIVFWIVGLGDGDFVNFLIFLVLLTLVGFCAIALGMIVAASAPTPEAATAFGPIIVVLMILFGGFYINIESLPIGIRWIQYLSLMRIAFEGLAVNEFSDLTFTCDDIAAGGVCIQKGEEVLARLSFENSVLDVCWMLLLFLACEHIIAYTILRLKKRKFMSLVPEVKAE